MLHLDLFKTILVWAEPLPDPHPILLRTRSKHPSWQASAECTAIVKVSDNRGMNKEK